MCYESWKHGASPTDLGEDVKVVESSGHFIGPEGVALRCLCNILPARVLVE